MRIAGPTMFSHYESDPELTAQSVVDGWFLTSDEGRFAEDGRLEIVGRIDDVVISGGVKIPLSAVADRIRQHLQVEQAEVFGVPDAEWGQKLVAVVVGTANDAELRDWISMVHPRSWAPREFVRAGSLPLLANGKVDRQAIQAGALMPDASALSPPFVFSIPLRTRFRGITVREGVLLRGEAGWGEWSPFLEYDDATSRPWLACAREAADEGWPEPLRDRVPVNVTVPATDPERAHAIVLAGGCRTAKVKVAERGQVLADDLARVEAVRDALGPDGLIRVDANGAWDVDEAVRAIAALDRAAGGLEYVEQPVASVEDLAVVRRRVGVPIAADESIRRADDPYRVRDLEAADIAVLKVQPLGGVRACLRIAEDIGHAGRRLQRRRVERRHRRRGRPRGRPARAAPRLRARDDPAPHRRRRRRADAAGRRHARRHPARAGRRRAPPAGRARRPGGPLARAAGVGRAGSASVTNPSTELARTVVTALRGARVREVVLAPGSRNAPLSFALYDAAQAGGLRLHTRIDERTAAFLALGLAKVGGRPGRGRLHVGHRGGATCSRP